MQVNRLHADGSVHAPPMISMPLQAPSREDAFSARVQRVATFGIMGAGDCMQSTPTSTVEALQDDMDVYAELNVLLGDVDLDEPLQSVFLH